MSVKFGYLRRRKENMVNKIVKRVMILCKFQIILISYYTHAVPSVRNILVTPAYSSGNALMAIQLEFHEPVSSLYYHINFKC